MAGITGHQTRTAPLPQALHPTHRQPLCSQSQISQPLPVTFAFWPLPKPEHSGDRISGGLAKDGCLEGTHPRLPSPQALRQRRAERWARCQLAVGTSQGSSTGFSVAGGEGRGVQMSP